ncbi:MAG: helix-turn-helix transcriptional regulator [Methylococcales bacterium]
MINLKRCFKLALQASGMTQVEVAEKCKFTKQLLNNVVAGGGTMSVEKLDQCANIMGFKLHEFIALADAKCEVRTIIEFNRDI